VTTAGQVQVCYRHDKRETYVRCTRCDRYICGDCMRSAPVGQQCVDCVREGNKTVRQAVGVFGGRITDTPVATFTLIALNVLAYLGELVRPGMVDRFGMFGEGLANAHGKHYVYDGYVYPGFHAIGVAHGEWYRLISGTFMHLLPTQGGFGILHIVFNMTSLWAIGRVVERTLGSVRFVALYLLSALGGSVLVFLIAPHTETVGASGAIFGLTGAYFVFSRRLGRNMPAANRLIINSVIWMVVSAAITSWQGHLGGLLTGCAVALAFAYAPRERRALVQAGAAAGVFILLVLLVVFKTSTLTGEA
jgi:membrane associated rhomboid family serine protease